MYGNGAATGMAVTGTLLRPIQPVRPVAPAVCAVGVVGAATPGAAVFPIVTTALLSTVAATSVCAFVSSSSSERHDTAAAGLGGNDAQPSGRIVRQARSLYVNPQIYP